MVFSRGGRRLLELAAGCSRRLNQASEFSLFVFGLAMALIVAVQVFCRYVLNQSLFWSEEVARYLLVWLTFIGAAVAYRRRVNPGIDVVFTRLPPAGRRLASLVVHLVSAAFFLVMIIYGCRFAWFVRRQISPAVSLPKWLVFSVIPVSGLLLLVHAVYFLLAELAGEGEGDDR